MIILYKNAYTIIKINYFIMFEQKIILLLLKVNYCWHNKIYNNLIFLFPPPVVQLFIATGDPK